MPDNHLPSEGTIRDARPGETASGIDAPKLRLSVLTVSHERFRIIRTYAQGGLGVVSIAHDSELDRVVAVKEMLVSRPNDDDVQRFLLEARLTGQLDHPGIPPVYALGYFEDGRPFYAMRLVDGVTLRSAIKEFHAKYPAPDLSLQRSMQLRQLIGAVVSVCNTLRFAHSRGVLHRDIKPSNIMLGEYGETLLMDWGLAKSQKQSLPYSEFEAKAYQQRKRLEDPEDTGTGSVMGTPHYMSPEQAVGDGESINQRSEVYSVGATLYSVLTGKPPFTGQTREEILDKVRRGDFQPPRALDARVPPELNAICLKAMALERGDRYADTGELATDIEHWLAHESVSCYREPPSKRWQRFFKAHQAVVASTAVLMVTFAVGLLLFSYVVTVEHTQAVVATARADEATQKAQSITEQTRELLSQTFVTAFNSRIRNIPGTEKLRLDAIDLFVKQFESWCQADPDSFQNQQELSQALYERSLIFDELNEVDKAWADLRMALRLLDLALQSPTSDYLASIRVDRLNILSQMARLENEMQWDPHSGDPVAQQAYYWAEQAGRTNSTVALFQYHWADAAMQLGIAKAQRGELNEAFELLSRASSIFQSILATSWQADIDRTLTGGVESSKLLLLQSKHEQAKTAWQLGDWRFAVDQSQAVEATLNEMAPSAADAFDHWLLRQANQVALAKFGSLANSSRAERARLEQLADEIEKALRDRPKHRRLLLVRAEARVALAQHHLFYGNLQTARGYFRSAASNYHELNTVGQGAAAYLSALAATELELTKIERYIGEPELAWTDALK